MSEGGGSPLAAWAPPRERRKLRRWLVELSAAIEIAGRRLDGTVRDISPDGAHIEIAEPFDAELGAPVLLTLAGYGTVDAQVSHRFAGMLGLVFRHDDEDALRLARHLVDGRSAWPRRWSAPAMPARRSWSTASRVAPPHRSPHRA